MNEIKIDFSTPSSCQICSNKTLVKLGSKDFGVSGNDHFESKRMFPDYGLAITYYRCATCDFIFTNAFDLWSDEDFISHIYNQEYILSDPVFMKERPQRNANMVFALFSHEPENFNVLDFGSGNGTFTHALNSMGIKTSSFDYFHNKNFFTLTKFYDLITSFEVIEHVPHYKQHEWIINLKALLKPNHTARVILSTKLLGRKAAFNDWYIAPRNGHISIHSEKSLDHLVKNAGLTLFSLNNGMHFLSHENNMLESSHFNTEARASLRVNC